MSEWQPIETAPKDGTEILVLFEGRRYLAKWSAVIHKDNKMWVATIPFYESAVERLGPELDVDGNLVTWGRAGPQLWTHLPEPPK